MRATHLGSNGLTALVECFCGVRHNFSLKLWEYYGHARCRWCGQLIEQKTLRVFEGGPRMADGRIFDDLTAEEKAEFSEEIAEVGAGVEHLQRAVRLLEGRGYKVRAHKLSGSSTSAQAQVYLLIQDWRDRKQVA